jgi:hypothetical protein
MGRWKLKDPNKYPAKYGTLLLTALEQFKNHWMIFSDHRTYYEARMAADHFREWRFNLRNFQTTRGWNIERDYSIRCKITKPKHPGDYFTLWLKVEDKRLTSLLDLNPELNAIE